MMVGKSQKVDFKVQKKPIVGKRESALKGWE